MYCYCIYCKTEKAPQLARAIEKSLGYRALIARQFQHIRKEGAFLDIRRNILPGYVFLYTPEPLTEHWRLWQLPGTIRLLMEEHGISGSEETKPNCYELSGHDREFALLLHRQNGILGRLQVTEEKESRRFRLQEELEAAGLRILKVDRRKQRMQISLPLTGQELMAWVEFEIINADED